MYVHPNFWLKYWIADNVTGDTTIDSFQLEQVFIIVTPQFASYSDS